MEVRQRAMKRGELGSNPRLLGSGPLGRRSTGTGVAMLTASAKACKRKISQEQENKCAQEKLFPSTTTQKKIKLQTKNKQIYLQFKISYNIMKKSFTVTCKVSVNFSYYM